LTERHQKYFAQMMRARRSNNWKFRIWNQKKSVFNSRRRFKPWRKILMI